MASVPRDTKRAALFSTHFLDDVEYWVRTDRRTALRLLRIVRETIRDPSGGIGKPEPLRGELRGLWSRRLIVRRRVKCTLLKTKKLDHVDTFRPRQADTGVPACAGPRRQK